MTRLGSENSQLAVRRWRRAERIPAANWCFAFAGYLSFKLSYRDHGRAWYQLGSHNHSAVAGFSSTLRSFRIYESRVARVASDFPPAGTRSSAAGAGSSSLQ